MLGLVASLSVAALALIASTPRIICSDVDGTLLNTRHALSTRTASTVLRAADLTTFAACTGRGRKGAYDALGPVGRRLRQSGAPGVFLNGLVVYGRDGELLRDAALERDIVLEAAAFAADNGLTVVGCSDERSLCEARDTWTAFLAAAYDPDPEPLGPWPGIAAAHRINKLLLLAPPSVITEVRPLLAERLGRSASLVVSVDCMLEVLPAGASKGGGVALLLDHLGLQPSEAMAMGDAENDLGMLQLVGTSVAMGNAPDFVKRAARHVTASNDEDGAALAIEAHFFDAVGAD